MRPPSTVELRLEYSKQGCGLFMPPQGARVTLEVHAPDSPDGMKQVVLRGDRAGLHALAAAIVSTAESPVLGFHLHIDEEVDGPVFRSPEGYTLTIDRFKK